MPEQQHQQDVEDVVRARLRALRTTAGWSLADLSRESGIGASTLSRMETGERRLGLDQLAPVCRALGVGLDELVANDDPDEVLLRPRAERLHGMTVWSLTRQRQPGRPNVFKLTIPAARRTPRTRTHAGREWLYVLSGSLRLVLGQRDVIMQPGQAAEFSTLTPHWLGAHAGRVELLVMFDESGESTHLGR